MLNKIYKLIGRPVIGVYGKWYKYIIPKKLTITKTPSVYKWLWWNFSWNL